LDRKSKSKEFEGEPASQHSSSNNNKLSKYWPLGRNRDTRHAPATKSVSSERLQVKEQSSFHMIISGFGKAETVWIYKVNNKILI
jgi:hypothetical protein